MRILYSSISPFFFFTLGTVPILRGIIRQRTTFSPVRIYCSSSYLALMMPFNFSQVDILTRQLVLYLTSYVLVRMAALQPSWTTVYPLPLGQRLQRSATDLPVIAAGLSNYVDELSDLRYPLD